MTPASDARDLPQPPRDDYAATRWTLIERLRRWDEHESWREFFQIYWRLIHGVAVRTGCTHDEAVEVVQETVISVAKEMRRGGFKLGPEFGSFKSWLLRITQRRVVDQLRKRPPAGRFVENLASAAGGDAGDSSQLDSIQDDSAEAYWDREWENHLLEAALLQVKAKVKPKHFQAFHLLTVKGFESAQVAAALNVSRTQVYLYKHRVGNQVKKELKRLMENPY